jgi:hypothetical protein
VVEPEAVLAQHVRAAELASFPIQPQFLPAHLLAHVFVDLVQFKGQSAAPALTVQSLALGQQVRGELPEVDEGAAVLAGDEYLALFEEVVAFDFETFVAVLAGPAGLLNHADALLGRCEVAGIS